GTCILLLLSGVLWLLFDRWVLVTGEFGATHHPLQAWWLKLHGAAAMGFLIALGSLLPIHVRSALRLRKNVRSGLLTLAAAGALIVTGYALYYVGGESLRPWLSRIHWIAGLLAVPLLLAHARLGKRGARTE